MLVGTYHISGTAEARVVEFCTWPILNFDARNHSPERLKRVAKFCMQVEHITYLLTYLLTFYL